MCTVTAYSSLDKLIVTMNRDENKDRHEDGWKINSTAKINLQYPVDGKSGGTWIGVNSNGLIVCLLNRYQDVFKADRKSRGKIILEALTLEKRSNIINWLTSEFSPVEYNPFQLLIFSKQNINHFAWNGQKFNMKSIQKQPWLFISSSSVDADQVLPYREKLFDTWIRQRSKPRSIIDLHLHQNPNLTSKSINMQRANSHTKSLTQLRINYKKRNIDISYINENTLATLTNQSYRKAIEAAENYSLHLTG